MKRELKVDGTLLTATDQEVSKLVLQEVMSHFPRHGVLSEEGDTTQLNSEYLWLCDPVDGTLPFAHGVPTCAFSLGLVRDGVPVAGVIYDPFIDRLYYAEKGTGATLNGVRIHVSEDADVLYRPIGCVYWRTARFNLGTLDQKFTQQGGKILAVGSTAYMGMLVASGEFIANVWPGETPWDAAAMKIIVEEAGGKVTDLFGKDQRYDGKIRGILVTNGVTHAYMTELIRESIS
ncbi:MAG: Inositol-phosphate phosphatase [Parcubacteria group bacterium GW2011_GWC2_49_9]|nr:MAG: Inositol-phosphate phosphatase [Parcubacteria group bacterium GW2011_GWA2_48_9]KKW16659.1 MAG: Inositol-phosphate phosphatase [Parcubacteria group bacterium GW2011_GWC2_49_9]